jgi:hypothetical protein
VLVIAADTLYNEWTDTLWPSAGGGQFNLHQVFALNSILRNYCDVNLLRWALIEGPTAMVNNKGELKTALRAAIRTQYGNNIVIQTVINKLREVAFSEKVAKSSAVIITGLEGSDFDDVERLFVKARTLLAPLDKKGKWNAVKVKTSIVDLLTPADKNNAVED